jgi:hypothetical protein
MTERFRHLHLFMCEHVDKLQRVDHALSLKMVIGDHESGLGVFGDVRNPCGPGQELLLGIKVVVALVARHFGVVAEPGIFAAPVQTDVPQRRRDALSRLDRTADERLIDVADSDLEFVQEECRTSTTRGYSRNVRRTFPRRRRFSSVL